MFSATFDKQDEDDQVLDEIEIIIFMDTIRNLAESDKVNIDVRSQPEQKVQSQISKDSGWRFDESISMTIYVYKTSELNVSIYVKIPMRDSAILIFENCDTNCFL